MPTDYPPPSDSPTSDPYTRPGIRHLVATRGTPEQFRRYEARVLPFDEMLMLVRDVAFLGFGTWPRLVRIEHARSERDKNPRNPVPHAAGCSRPDPEFTVTPKQEFDAHQFATFAKLEACAGRTRLAWAELDLDRSFTSMNLGARIHRGACPECGGHLERMAVMVTVLWEGYILTREYAL